jgi:hypothetical protein
MSPESLLEEHDDGCIVNLRYNVSLVAEALDKLLRGFSLLLYDAGQVPVDTWSRAHGPKVADELLAQVRPRTE